MLDSITRSRCLPSGCSDLVMYSMTVKARLFSDQSFSNISRIESKIKGNICVNFTANKYTLAHSDLNDTNVTRLTVINNTFEYWVISLITVYWIFDYFDFIAAIIVAMVAVVVAVAVIIISSSSSSSSNSSSSSSSSSSNNSSNNSSSSSGNSSSSCSSSSSSSKSSNST